MLEFTAGNLFSGPSPSPVDSDDGNSSIADCLVAASGELPDDVDLIEVKYRGVHMGTFRKVNLQEGPGDVAERIAEMYGVLVGGLSPLASERSANVVVFDGKTRAFCQIDVAALFQILR